MGECSGPALSFAPWPTDGGPAGILVAFVLNVAWLLVLTVGEMVWLGWRLASRAVSCTHSRHRSHA